MAFFSSLFRPRNDAYETPACVIDAVRETLRACIDGASRQAQDPDTHWTIIDPAAGDGRIGVAAAAQLRALVAGKITLTLIDVDRVATLDTAHLRGQRVAIKRMQCNFLRWSRFSPAQARALQGARDARVRHGPCIVVGNPPFTLPGVARNGVVKFAEHACGRFVHAQLVVFVVPLSMRAQKAQNKLPETCRLVRDTVFDPRPVQFTLRAPQGADRRSVSLRVGVQAWRVRLQGQTPRRPPPLRLQTFAQAPIALPMTTRPQFLAALRRGESPDALVRCKGNLGAVGVLWWSRERDAQAFHAELERMTRAQGKGLDNFWVTLDEAVLPRAWFGDAMQAKKDVITRSLRDVSVNNVVSLTRAEFLHLLLCKVKEG